MNISKNILDDMITVFEPDSIYIVGSSIQNINTPNDIDVLVLYKNKESYLSHKKRKTYVDVDKKIEIFTNFYEHEMSETINKCFAWTSLKLGIHIYGDDLLKLYNFDQYDLVKSADYRRIVCGYIQNEFASIERKVNENRIIDNENPRLGTNYLYKCYRLLLICYIISNKSYDLTEEQIQILNKVHDDLDMSEELWTWCKEIVNKEAHQV